MAEIFRIAALALIGTLCAVMVKRSSAEIGLVLTLAVVALLLFLIMDEAGGIFEAFRDLGQASGLSSDVLAPMLKTVGIGIVTRIAADFCRDAKEGGIASAVELAGAAAALIAALPLLHMVLRTLTNLL